MSENSHIGQNRLTPPNLIGGVPNTSPVLSDKIRALPALRLDDGADGCAVPLADGLDTVVETYDMALNPRWEERLAEAKEEARKLDAQGRHTVPLTIITAEGMERLAVAAFAPGGARYMLGNDDFQITIRNTDRWAVSVRLLAAGLWEHGRPALIHRSNLVLFEIGRLNVERRIDSDRLSRLDYAMDFYSPDFTREMVPAITEKFVAGSGIKFDGHMRMVGAAARLQTLYIGARKSTCQIVIYDKGREISEASGKTWMYPLWEASGQWSRPRDEHGNEDRTAPVKDVWRIEVRFKGEHLKNRKVGYPEHALAALPELISEALVNRRLCIPNGDPNRARWPVAPLWSAALKIKPSKNRLALGRMVTARRAAHISALVDQAAGTLRTAAALERNAGSVDEFKWALAEAYEEMKSRIDGDEDMFTKAERVRRRYEFFDEAR